MTNTMDYAVSISRNSIKKRVIAILLFSLLLTIIATMLLVVKKYFNIGIRCTFYEILHIYCPGCGGTRMIVALSNLDLYQAFRYNPFLFVTSPILFVTYIQQSILYIKYERFSNYLDKLLIVYAIILIIFGIIRNIGIFSWLAPTVI